MPSDALPPSTCPRNRFEMTPDEIRASREETQALLTRPKVKRAERNRLFLARLAENNTAQSRAQCASADAGQNAAG